MNYLHLAQRALGLAIVGALAVTTAGCQGLGVLVAPDAMMPSSTPAEDTNSATGDLSTTPKSTVTPVPATQVPLSPTSTAVPTATPSPPVSPSTPPTASSASNLPTKPVAGAQAPGLSLPDLEGKEVSLESLRGKVVLLNFWASW